MKNAFYFIWKALFAFKVLKFLSLLFGHAEKQPNKKAKFNFKIHDIADWETKNYNAHIAQYLKKYRQSGHEMWLVNRV